MKQDGFKTMNSISHDLELAWVFCLYHFQVYDEEQNILDTNPELSKVAGFWRKSPPLATLLTSSLEEMALKTHIWLLSKVICLLQTFLITLISQGYLNNLFIYLFICQFCLTY